MTLTWARRSVVLLVLGVATLLVASALRVMPAAAAAGLPAPTPDPRCLTAQGQVSNSEVRGVAPDGAACIAGSVYSTRQRITDDSCFANPKATQLPNPTNPFPAIYRKSGCKDPKGTRYQVESVAQARMIAQLDLQSPHGDVTQNLPGTPNISPNIQWEVAVPGASGNPIYPDILVYNRTDPTGAISIIENKVKGTASLPAIRAQLLKYETALNANGQDRAVVRWVGVFYDLFGIRTDCDSAGQAKLSMYTSSFVESGIVLTEKVGNDIVVTCADDGDGGGDGFEELTMEDILTLAGAATADLLRQILNDHFGGWNDGPGGGSGGSGGGSHNDEPPLPHIPVQPVPVGTIVGLAVAGVALALLAVLAPEVALPVLTAAVFVGVMFSIFGNKDDEDEDIQALGPNGFTGGDPHIRTPGRIVLRLPGRR